MLHDHFQSTWNKDTASNRLMRKFANTISYALTDLLKEKAKRSYAPLQITNIAVLRAQTNCWDRPES